MGYKYFEGLMGFYQTFFFDISFLIFMNYVNVFLLTFYSFLLSVSLLSQSIHEIDIHLDNPDSLKQSAINLGQFTQFASVLDLDLDNSLDEPSLNLTVN